MRVIRDLKAFDIAFLKLSSQMAKAYLLEIEQRNHRRRCGD
jgi:hypothetical protein